MVNGVHSRLVLHPGMPKCASSAIQSTLARYRAALETEGCDLLNRELDVEFGVDGHQGVPYSILFQAKQGSFDLIEHFRKVISKVAAARGASNLSFVLSSEVLSNCADPSWRAVHEAIYASFDEVEVHVAVRSPWSFLLSNWKQGQYRTGVSFADYARMAIGAAKRSDGLGYWHRRIASLKEVYGGNVRVYALEAESNFLEYFFLRALSLRVNGQQSRRVVNESLNGILCAILSNDPSLFETEVADIEYLLPRGKNLIADFYRKRGLRSSEVFSNGGDWCFRDDLLDIFQTSAHSYKKLLMDCVGTSEERADNIIEREKEKLLAMGGDGDQRSQRRDDYLERLVCELYGALVDSLLINKEMSGS